jgi:hypothetical protein
MNASAKAGVSDARVLLVDAHVHIYDCYDIDALFDAAAGNFSRMARKLGIAGAHRDSMLLLTETAHDHAFDALAAGQLRPKRWAVEKTAEPAVLRISLDRQVPLWLVAGRQIATSEDLEVLALGTTRRFPDGEPISVSLAAVEQAAELTALPWGFGKWWGARGGIIQRLMSGPRIRPLYAGDNGGRLAFSARPKLLQVGERLGVKVLPGTDPLPFAGQEARVGSFGMLIHDWQPGDRPLGQLAARLAALPGSPQRFGGLTGITSFVKLQIAMQLRKRRRRRVATTVS